MHKPRISLALVISFLIRLAYPAVIGGAITFAIFSTVAWLFPAEEKYTNVFHNDLLFGITVFFAFIASALVVALIHRWYHKRAKE